MTTLRRPELVFFDVGDTPLRADPSWADVYLVACRAWGLHVDREALAHALLTSTSSAPWSHEGPFEASETASWDRIKEFDTIVMRELGYEDLPEDFYRAVEDVFAARETWHIYPDVLPALGALAAAGIRRAVISNWPWEAPRLLHDLELAAHFEQLIISARVGYQKPHRRIFEHALEATGVTPERAVHVGDSYRADVLGARSVGIEPVLIDRAIGDLSRVTSAVPAGDDVPVVTDLFGLLDLIGVDRPAMAASA